MSSYRLRPSAISDLEDIWLYTFQEWSVSQAESYHSDIILAIEGLASDELQGRISDIKDGYMTYLVGSHIIFYRFSGDGIDVVRILHQSRDFARHL